MSKEYNDKMVSLFTLLEEYKYLMVNTRCEAMRAYFKGRFEENCRRVEELLQQQHMKESYRHRGNFVSKGMMDFMSRQVREFTIEELTKYNGRRGMPAYVAVDGIVYDLSNVSSWGGGTHFGLVAGENLSAEYMSCHGVMDILAKLSRVGTIRG
ncbi:MAG: cytochrome b5 domain-containing protein [Bacillota bacterium]|nr:cytochrome b5 domain-containing protein [Bacillota bacterium]